MKTVVVTGGAGFIGTNLVRFLSKNKSLKIVVFDKLTYAGKRSNLDGLDISFVRGDLSKKGQVKRLFDEFKPDMVFNLAAESHVDRSINGPSKFIKTNIFGTFHLLEAVRAQKKPVRFLHVSTDEVYGSLGRIGSFKETTPYRPNSPYSATKASSDHIVNAYHTTYGLQTLITNCSNNYGPYQHIEKMIPQTITRALAGKEIPIYGDGSNVRDWIYVEDHCSALWNVMQKGTAGENYNVGGGEELTNKQLVKTILEKLAMVRPGNYKRLIRFVKDRPGHDKRYSIDNSKIRKKIGWQPNTTFENGIRKTISWYLNEK